MTVQLGNDVKRPLFSFFSRMVLSTWGEFRD